MPGLGQRAGLRRAVEQLLAEVDLEPPDRLADGRLGAVHLGGGAREAALLGHGEKHLQRGEVHAGEYNRALLFVNHYHFDFYPAGGYNWSHEHIRHASSSSTPRCATASRRPGFSMDVPAKLAMARALDALGVDIIEAGFPIASPADAEAVRQIAREVRRPVIAALAR